MNSVLMRLFGTVCGALTLGALCLIGMTAAAAAVAAAAKGAAAAVVGVVTLLAVSVGFAFAAAKSGH